MKRKYATIVAWTLFLAGVVITLLGYGNETVFNAGMIVSSAALIPVFLFNKCPHCGRWLDRSSGKFCPHCGKPLD